MGELKVYKHMSQYPDEAVTLETGYRMVTKDWTFSTDAEKVQKMIERSARFKSGMIQLLESDFKPEASGPKTSTEAISTKTGKQPKKVQVTEEVKND